MNFLDYSGDGGWCMVVIIVSRLAVTAIPLTAEGLLLDACTKLLYCSGTIVLVIDTCESI